MNGLDWTGPTPSPGIHRLFPSSLGPYLVAAPNSTQSQRNDLQSSLATAITYYIEPIESLSLSSVVGLPDRWSVAGWRCSYFGIEYLGQEEDSHYTDPYIIKPSASRLIVYLQLARPTPSGEAAAADLFVVCFDGWCLLAGWALLLFLFLRKTIVLGAPRAFTILLLL